MTTLVLLPGMDGTGALFARFVSASGNDFRSIIVSYPTHQPLGYEALAEFARTCLPENEPFILLGESFSGPVAISLAAARPPGLKALVLCCSFDRNPLPFFHRLARFVDLLPISSNLIRMAAPLLFGRWSSASLNAELRQALTEVSPDILRARLRAVLKADMSNDLRRVDVPILYLRATHDRVVPSVALSRILTVVPSVKVTSVLGPHLLLQTAPSESAEALRSFVTSFIPIKRTTNDKDI